jgi:hypothetical protein
MAIDYLKKQHSMKLAVLIFVFHFVFLAIYIYIYLAIAIAIAIAIATQKKAATKATTSLPTPLYQWMDDSSIYLIHEGVQPLSHFSSQTKICHSLPIKILQLHMLQSSQSLQESL